MSWGYEVDDDATSTPKKACTVLASAADTARSYARHVTPHGDATSLAVLVRFLHGTSDVEPAVRGFFAHLNEVATASANALSACAVVYRVTDQGSSGRVVGAGVGSGAGTGPGTGSGSW
ncbi:MAG: hypothetical protein U0Q14_04410 [Dermatophilaceae bacterium]|jgi:hypothetical protein|nr:hypothetical protein [Dermatophilaceae bacterium]